MSSSSFARSSLSQQPSTNPTTNIPYGYVPAYLAGSASLVEELDAQLLIVLRDGRHLVGTLRSFDQYSNMILEDTSERRMCVDNTTNNNMYYYSSIPLGCYVVRGDNVVLLGKLTAEQNDDSREVSLEELEEIIMRQQSKQNEELMTSTKNWDFDRDLEA